MFVCKKNQEYKGGLTEMGEQSDFGHYRFANGRREYYGQFLRGLMHGWGTLMFNTEHEIGTAGGSSSGSGGIWEGEMAQGEPHGKGIWYYYNGDRCEVKLVKGLAHGISIYQFNSTGLSVPVEWNMGSPNITLLRYPFDKIPPPTTFLDTKKTMGAKTATETVGGITSGGCMLLMMVMLMVMRFCYLRPICGLENKANLRLAFIERSSSSRKSKISKSKLNIQAVQAVAVQKKLSGFTSVVSVTKKVPVEQATKSNHSDIMIEKKCSTSSNFRNDYCSYCETSLGILSRHHIKKCQCAAEFYCSHACQQKHWKTQHKLSCSYHHKKQKAVYQHQEQEIASSMELLSSSASARKESGSSPSSTTELLVRHFSQQQFSTNLSDESAMDYSPPYHLRCPITGELMIDPVVAADGET
jgi:uncharacterized protein with PIN domain